jgi:lysyl-tRNA synthetase class 2
VPDSNPPAADAKGKSKARPASALAQVRNNRIEKIEKLRTMGIDPYPSRSERSHELRRVIEDFDELEGKTVTVVGRLMSRRKQGAMTFGHLQDQSGRIQLFIRRDDLQETSADTGSIGYKDLSLLDVGDIVGATGTVMKTKRGEISVQPESIRMLAKSLRPMPEKWAGLKDREAVLRRRYLDTIFSDESRERFEAISKMLFVIRSFLRDEGFLEFHTPVLQPEYGGGSAKPFTTHANAIGQSMYLSISHELYLKRLVAGGFEKVFTIGRYFRNEGLDRSHHPEFTMLETMTAYENYEYNMDLVERLFRAIGEQAFGRTTFRVRGFEIDFAKPWRRVGMAEVTLEVTGVDFRECGSVEEANAHLEALGIHEKQPSIGTALVRAFEEKVEETLTAPTFVTGHPVDISPLAKPMADDPRYAERFEIFLGGMECGDNWTEQNDPVQLLDRWKQQSALAVGEAVDEIQPYDWDFLEALEHGMPPTTGLGPGIERMAMIFTEQENIDDVIYFPMMRRHLSELNRGIYGLPATAPDEGSETD